MDSDIISDPSSVLGHEHRQIIKLKNKIAYRRGVINNTIHPHSIYILSGQLEGLITQHDVLVEEHERLFPGVEHDYDQKWCKYRNLD